MTADHTETAKEQGNAEPEKVGYAHPPRDKQFKPGYDPRRNTKGVPKDAIAARKLIRQVGQELIAFKDAEGEGDITRLYLLIRSMYSSRNPRHAEILLKALFPGLLKDEIDVNETIEYHVTLDKD